MMEQVELLSLLQTVSILIGIGLVVIKFGRRDQQLIDNTTSIKELRKLSHELLMAIAQTGTNTEHHQRTLDELKRRIERLEERHARTDAIHHAR
jgi:uncharacterized pyridoxal phosphate-containing UPF0001 family protein